MSIYSARPAASYASDVFQVDKKLIEFRPRFPTSVFY